MSVNKSNTSRTDQMTADQTLADGMTQYAKQIGTLTIDNEQYKAADIVKVLQGRIAVQKPIAPARANLSKAVAAANTELASTHALILAVRVILGKMFGNDPTMLLTLGLTTAKVSEPTPAVKVAAAAKAKATRAAKKAAPAPVAPVATAPAPAETPAPGVKPQS